MRPEENSEIFTVKARRCKRCGGLLTSPEAVKQGYGHICKKRAEQEKQKYELMQNQITFFEKE